MGYQALLICPDTKLATVVTQIFNELDFVVDAVHEPFAAVKKLMTQHYDAVVVDGANDQNASLLFKSARNSSFNQGSLAIALVEGQTGVAKAYRIGANLVLTKPINIEQAKGTLRVARGLLRKTSDIAGTIPGNTPFAANAAASAATFEADNLHATNDDSSTPPANNALEYSAPIMTISPVAVSPIVVSPNLPNERRGALSRISASTEDNRHVVATAGTQNIAISESAPTAAPSATAEVKMPTAPTAAGSAAAAATAPAKEAHIKLTKTSQIASAEPANARSGPSPAVSVSASTSSTTVSHVPSFAALGETDVPASGGNKKIFIGIAAVVILIALGYMGYEKIYAPATNAPHSQPVSAPANSDQPAPVLRPMSAPALAPNAKDSTTIASESSPSAAPHRVGSSSATGGAPQEIRIAADLGASSDAEVKAAPKPILVKSGGLAANKHLQEDESAPPVASALADSSATDKNLTGLMSSVSPNFPKAPLTKLKVSQGVSQGLLIKRVTPTYPKAALAVHAQGTVLIEATIDREGNVKNAKVLRGDSVLARAALDAVHQWRYKPYYLDGAPVEIQTQITVNFKAD
jgi:TonB family protein